MPRCAEAEPPKPPEPPVRPELPGDAGDEAEPAAAADGDAEPGARPGSGCAVATSKEIWVRTPDMDDGNEVKLDVRCDNDVADIRSLAMGKLSFGVGVKEGEVEVATAAGDPLKTRTLVGDLTDDTLIVRIAQKRPVPPSPPPEADAGPTAAAPAEGAPARAEADGEEAASSLLAAAGGSTPLSLGQVVGGGQPSAKGGSHQAALPSPAPDGRVQSLCLADDAPPPFVEVVEHVVHIDRVPPDLPDACLRQAVEDQVGRVVALEVVRGGVSEEARSQHFASAYAFAFLAEPPRSCLRSPTLIDVSHRDVSGRVTRLGAGPPAAWPQQERVRVRMTNKSRNEPTQPEPRASLHVRIFARLTRESGWAERLQSIKWPGFLALIEAARERMAPGAPTPTDHIMIIADDRGCAKSPAHANVLLSGFFVQCHSVADARKLMAAVRDHRVCCEGVTFLLQCDYTLKEKKLYDRCGRRETYKDFYAQHQQEYEEARRKARGAVEGARAYGSLGRMLDEDGGFFAFGDKHDTGPQASANPPDEQQQHRAPSVDSGAVARMPPGLELAQWRGPFAVLPGGMGPPPDADQLAHMQQIQALQLQQMMALQQLYGGAAVPPAAGVTPPPGTLWAPSW